MDYILRRKFLNNNPQISTLKLNKIDLHCYLIKRRDFFYHQAKKVSYLLTLLKMNRTNSEIIRKKESDKIKSIPKINDNKKIHRF